MKIPVAANRPIKGSTVPLCLNQFIDDFNFKHGEDPRLESLLIES